MNNAEIKAWFLGPKAENEAVFEQMLMESWRDYCYWRRNFHPEDTPWVGVQDKLSPEFQEYVANLHQHLFEMLSHLKRSTPSFSPRYLGHMMTDLLMPGVLGSLSAMLYNQNNITEEAATITLQFEEEAMALLAQMVGFPAESAWGHLCSGGTLANIESLWMARNLLTLPWQLALTLQEQPQSILRSIAAELSPECLQTLTIPSILSLQKNLTQWLSQDEALAGSFQTNSLGQLGMVDFRRKCQERLGKEPVFCIAVSHNTHYSLHKALDILGLGQKSLLAVPLNLRMEMDISALKHLLDGVQRNGHQILAVIAVYGSTEEGAIDDFVSLHQLREYWRESKQGDFWIHADACYGGYALAMCHHRINAAQLHQHFRQKWQHSHSSRSERQYIPWDIQQCDEWLKIARAVGLCDSISIDPHKMGYLPYPAGAVIYRDYYVRETLRCDAPYINASSEPQETVSQWRLPHLGRYTLEGSRPGATGAALWLAHKTVPLDLQGHGDIVCSSILGARYLQHTLATFCVHSDAEITFQCRFLCPEPDLNILCYTFSAEYLGQPLPLPLLNRAVKRLYEECLATEKHPTATRQFVVAMTKLSAYTYDPDFLNDLLVKMGMNHGKIERNPVKPWRDDDHLALIRTVVMGPFLLDASTRPRLKGEPVALVEQFAEWLQNTLPQIFLDLLKMDVEQKSNSLHCPFSNVSPPSDI